MMGEDFNKMVEVVFDHERQCDVCKYQHDGCGGLTAGPNGPIYPPCADLEPEHYVDEDYLREVYDEIMEEESNV